uniref:Uncharacterized protein n=1 Tax=Arundo donax TaxID=35708 RepID=A0A0A8XP20_ARUDO
MLHKWRPGSCLFHCLKEESLSMGVVTY